MKSVHLATTHRATDPRIVQRECRSLAAAGHDVVLVIPHERDEIVQGVQIRAVPIPPTGRAMRLETPRHVARRAWAEAAPDAVFHLHEPDLIPLGLALKARGHRVVYDAHEDTPRQALHQHWIPTPLRRPAGWTWAALEALAGRFFDGIAAVIPEIAARFPARKTVLVRNYPLLDELLVPEAAPYAERAAVVAYVGALTEARGLREMLAAMAALPDDLGAELRLAGTFGPAALAEAWKTWPGAERARAEGYLDRAGVAQLLGEARVGLVTLLPSPQYAIAYPTKLFEYLAAGVPVVASDFPVWRRLVEDTGGGLLVDPTDPGAIAEAVRWLLEHPTEAEAMGRAGQAAVRARYGWDGEAETLLGLYARLSGGAR